MTHWICATIGHKFWYSPASNPWHKQPTTHCQRCGRKQG